MSQQKNKKLLLRYPPSPAGVKAKERQFKKIWPSLSRMYDGKTPKVFKQFSAIVYSSFSEPFLSGRTMKEHYHLLRYLFDFFCEPLKGYRAGGRMDASGKVKIEDPPANAQPQGGGHIAETGIMLNATEAPFMLENIGGYLNLSGHHVISGIYPVFTVIRKNGKVKEIKPFEEEGPKEVLLYFIINKVVNPRTKQKLHHEIESVLKTLYLSVGDFECMQDEVRELCYTLESNHYDPVDGAETAEFLRWLVPTNFIFMGITSFEFNGKGKIPKVEEHKKTRHGVFRDSRLMGTVFPGLRQEIKKRVTDSYNRKFMMALDFHTRAPEIIYHSEPVDIIIIRTPGRSGKPRHAWVLLGRFSRGALTTRSSDLPLLRKKLQRVIEGQNIRRQSHLYREIFSVFNNLPKRELFYIDRQTLGTLLNVSIELHSEDELHLIARKCREFEYLSIAVVIPTKKFNQVNLEKIIHTLEETTGRPHIFYQFSHSPVVAQIFIYFENPRDETPALNGAEVTKQLNEAITGWDQLLMQKLVDALGDQEGFSLYNAFASRLTDIYREVVSPDEAARDLQKLEEVEKTDRLQLDLLRRNDTTVTLRLYWNKELNLMKLIPTFANMGINVRDEIAVPLNSEDEKRDMFVQLLQVEHPPEVIDRIIDARDRLIDAIQRIINGELEDCLMNGLVLSAGLTWEEADFIRGLQNYSAQVNKLINPLTVTATIRKYPAMMRTIAEYFREKFDPSLGQKRSLEPIEEEYQKQLEQVNDLTEDNILRLLFSIVKSILRTNYYQEKPYHYVSYKIDCKGIPDMPRPVPMAEIYVHTPFLEGVHLRAGKVARGGLRWSDRADDYRTEILGLMKTQVVKNSVIVPTGSKGGFYLKKFKFDGPEEREEVFKHHYQTFIKGLLDVTDNLKGDAVVTPDNLVCYDEPDPYLVVAADKGTAAMSDAANEVSENRGFWLKDAFASGGRVGYDHKKYGITARGTWECVKRHFREMGTDIQSEPFTVAGVGSMSGDVFGNGILLSKKIRLQAAFNSSHIFLDPDPDPDTSWKERERLFKSEDSQWTDYNPALISKGGGVFDKKAKSIKLSSQVKEMLGVTKTNISGVELQKAILKMGVDLLYFGGIGTYVRATTETDSEVGDKKNDAIRVTARDLKAKVIGEGANLAITQRARIQFDYLGGRVNTDAVDNSAGVDISDHEVNLKILLEVLLNAKKVKGASERNRIFADMGPTIADMVLEDNYLQSAGITLDQIRSRTDMPVYLEYIDRMENKGLFNREDEDIPSGEVLAKYNRKPGHLPRPILCVLFGYEKIRIKKDIMDSPLPEMPFSKRYLLQYWPDDIQKKYGNYLEKHRLKTEIIATIVSNRVVNQAGLGFVHRMEGATGARPWEICRAYVIAANLVDADSFRRMVYALDNKADAALQMQMLLDIENLVRILAQWILTHRREKIDFSFIDKYQKPLEQFQENLFGKLEGICSLEEGCTDEKVKEYRKQGVPEELGKRLVLLPYLRDLMSIVSIKENMNTDLIETGNLFIKASNYLEEDWVYRQLDKYQPADKWEDMERESLFSELEDRQREFVTAILNQRKKGESMVKAFDRYTTEHQNAIRDFRVTTAALRQMEELTLPAISVLIRKLERLY